MGRVKKRTAVKKRTLNPRVCGDWSVSCPCCCWSDCCPFTVSVAHTPVDAGSVYFLAAGGIRHYHSLQCYGLGSIFKGEAFLQHPCQPQQRLTSCGLQNDSIGHAEFDVSKLVYGRNVELPLKLRGVDHGVLLVQVFKHLDLSTVDVQGRWYCCGCHIGHCQMQPRLFADLQPEDRLEALAKDARTLWNDISSDLVSCQAAFVAVTSLTPVLYQLDRLRARRDMRRAANLKQLQTITRYSFAQLLDPYSSLRLGNSCLTHRTIIALERKMKVTEGGSPQISSSVSTKPP